MMHNHGSQGTWLEFHRVIHGGQHDAHVCKPWVNVCTRLHTSANRAGRKKVCRGSVLFPLGAIGRKALEGPKTIQHSTSDGHHGIQQQQVSIVLTRVGKSVVSPMFLGSSVLTIANGPKIGYTNEKTGDSVIQKPPKNSLHKPCVAGSSPAFATSNSWVLFNPPSNTRSSADPPT